MADFLVERSLVSDLASIDKHKLVRQQHHLHVSLPGRKRRRGSAGDSGSGLPVTGGTLVASVFLGQKRQARVAASRDRRLRAQTQPIQRDRSARAARSRRASSLSAARLRACSRHERAVHHEQRLLRHRGGEALRAVRVGTGEIERAKQARQVLPVDQSVERAPSRPGRLRQLDRRPAQRRDPTARRRQQRIAQRFEIQPLAIHPPQQPILGIDCAALGPIDAGLLIGGRVQNQPVQVLERPVVLDQRSGQVVEQLRMGGRLAAQAEIAGRSHQRRSSK